MTSNQYYGYNPDTCKKNVESIHILERTLREIQTTSLFSSVAHSFLELRSLSRTQAGDGKW